MFDAKILVPLLILLKTLYSNCYDEENDKIQIIKVNSNLTVECPETERFELKYLIHDRSLDTVDIYQFNSKDLYKHFDMNRISFHNSVLFIQDADYTSSGRYYCVYKKIDDQKKLFILKNFTLIIYDVEDVQKQFGDSIEIKNFNFNKNIAANQTNNNRWLFNSKLLVLINQTNIIIDKNGDLKILLDDLNLFGHYTLQNRINGAFINYNVICVGVKCKTATLSSRRLEPILTPSNPSVPVGSNVDIQCDKPLFDDINEPDNYFWFKSLGKNETIVNVMNFDQLVLLNQSEANQNHVNSEFIFNGKVLQLRNVTSTQQAWYFCCLAYNTNDNDDDNNNNDPEYEMSRVSVCSSTFLGVEMNSKQKENEKKNLIPFFVSVCVIILLAIGLLCLIIFYRKRKHIYNLPSVRKYFNENRLYQSSSDSQSNSVPSKSNPSLPYEKSFNSIQNILDNSNSLKYKIPIESLKFGHILGKGAFGIVLYAEILPNNNDDDKKIIVAVKKLKENATSNNLHELFKELKCMMEMDNHPNIINLIGFSVDSKSLYIVTEYAKFGSLKDYLRKYDGKQERKKIDSSYLLLFSYQIAKGMEYLHMKKVLHRDLAARNILVAEEDLVKIADFGLARNIQSDYYYKQQADGFFPIKWMSPESLTLNKITKESDVWSYSVLLWEIWTFGCVPYPCVQPQQTLNLIKTGYRLEKPDGCEQEIYDLMMLCWKINPVERPTFTEIVKKLEDDFNLKNYKISSQTIYEKRHNNSTSSATNSSRISSSYSTDDFDSQNTKMLTISQSEDHEDGDTNSALIRMNSIVKLNEELKPFLNGIYNTNNNKFLKEADKNEYSIVRSNKI